MVVVSALDLVSSQTEQGKQSNPIWSPQSDQRVYQGSVQPKNFPDLPEEWVSEWETFPSSDGKLQLYSVIHHAKEWKGHRVLVVLHGLGEHGGRYLHCAHFVQSSVDAVYCLDHRGHGRSEGLRGHVDQFDLYVDDVALAISRLEENLQKRFGASEIHLLGHSMGGLITLRTLFKHQLPIASATISAPLLGIRVHTPIVKKYMGIALSRVWGSLHMSTELDASTLSHDQDVVKAYLSDRLVHNKVTPRFFTELQSAMADTLKRESGLSSPIQMMVPLQDQIVDPDASLQFFRALKLRDKLLKTYPDLFHEPFNEIGKEQVFEDLVSWIKNHSAT
jgi:alpha-beta hydrolase superfamily lysophospholipase